jgi:hypothetical protein
MAREAVFATEAMPDNALLTPLISLLALSLALMRIVSSLFAMLCALVLLGEENKQFLNKRPALP